MSSANKSVSHPCCSEGDAACSSHGCDIVEFDDATRWDSYVDQHPYGHPYAYFAWKRVIKEAYGTNVRTYAAVADGDALCGILGVYPITTFEGSCQWLSLHNAFLFDNEAIGNELLWHVWRRCCDEVDAPLRLHLWRNDLQPTCTKTNITEKCGLAVQLRSGVEEQRKALRSKFRNRIAKAKRDELSIQEGREVLREFYSCYAERLARKRAAVHSLRFFESLLESFGARARLLVAAAGGQVLGGMLLLLGKQRGVYAYGGTQPESGSCASQLLAWRLMTLCIEQGLGELDMGESQPGSGVYRFKELCGAAPYASRYVERHAGQKQARPWFAGAMARLDSGIWAVADRVGVQALSQCMAVRARRRKSLQ